MEIEDLKWVTRIILGDLNIHVGPKYILEALHPDAYNGNIFISIKGNNFFFEAYKVSHNLKDVVNRALGITATYVFLNMEILHM